MATTWMDYPIKERPTFLLANGELQEALDIEVTSTMRRARIKQYPKITSYYRDVDQLLFNGVEHVARERGTKIWMCVNGDEGVWHGIAPSASFRLRPNDLSISAAVRYKHPSLPIRAAIVIQATTSTYGKSLSAYLTHDSVLPNSKPSSTSVPLASLESNWQSPGPSEQRWVLDNPPPMVEQLSITEQPWSKLGMRGLVEVFTTHLYEVLNLASVQVPDYRVEGVPGWLELECVDDNANGEFLQSLNEFLDTGPALDRARAAYKELQEALSGIGVMLKVDDNEFTAALSGVDTEVFAPASFTPTSQNTYSQDAPDRFHTVHLDLANGRIEVACSVTANTEQIAEAWQIARFEAEMKDELDAFLGFNARNWKKMKKRTIR